MDRGSFTPRPRDGVAHRFFDRSGNDIRVAPLLPGQLIKGLEQRVVDNRVDRGAVASARRDPRRHDIRHPGEIALRGNRQGNCHYSRNRESLAYLQGFVAQRNEAIAVLAQAPAWYLTDDSRAARREQHNVSVARPDDMPSALQFGESHMFGEVNVLAMHGNGDLGSGAGVKLRDLAAARMTRGVHERGAIGDDFDA